MDVETIGLVVGVAVAAFALGPRYAEQQAAKRELAEKCRRSGDPGSCGKGRKCDHHGPPDLAFAEYRERTAAECIAADRPTRACPLGYSGACTHHPDWVWIREGVDYQWAGTGREDSFWIRREEWPAKLAQMRGFGSASATAPAEATAARPRAKAASRAKGRVAKPKSETPRPAPAPEPAADEDPDDYWVQLRKSNESFEAWRDAQRKVASRLPSAQMIAFVYANDLDNGNRRIYGNVDRLAAAMGTTPRAARLALKKATAAVEADPDVEAARALMDSLMVEPPHCGGNLGGDEEEDPETDDLVGEPAATPSDQGRWEAT